MRIVSAIALSSLWVALPAAAQVGPPNAGKTSSPPPLRAIAASRTSVQLSWRDPFLNETGFELQRAVGSPNFVPHAFLPADVTTFIDATAAPGTIHHYRLRAQFATGVSGWSNAASAATPANHLPTITCNVPQDVEFSLTSSALSDPDSFVVTATDPDGDRVSLTLLNPPPGAVFVPVIDAQSPATLRVRFDETLTHDLRFRLHFEARDSFDPAARARFVQRMTFAVPPGRITLHLSAGVDFGDVTGDGIDDVVVAAPFADIGTIKDIGAIYVWPGPLAASGAPAASLTIPSSFGPAFLGDSRPQGLWLADVTGDGVLDVVACGPFANVGGVVQAGACFVWAGGAALAGNVGPTATLLSPAPRFQDMLGQDFGATFLDFDGDGVLDLFVGSQMMANGGLTQTGGLLYWRGGPTLAGTPPPTAALFGPAAFDKLLWNPDGRGVEFGDVTGDGRLDVVASAPFADIAPKVNAGAIFVWDGTAMSGTPAPTATLTIPGKAWQIGMDVAGRAPRLADVDGDGQLDVISASLEARVGGSPFAGAAFVWSGGAGLVGTVAPTASLHRQPEVAYDYNGSILDIVDLTGDGVLDVLVGGTRLSYNGYFDSGGLLLFEGGPGMVGTPKQRAQLVNSAGGTGWLTRLVATVDLDEDGVLDVVSHSNVANLGRGAIWIWHGGAALRGVTDPHATLTHGGVANDFLGATAQFHDFDGDGHLDVLGVAPQADVGGVVDRGALFVFSGFASGWQGAIAPKATLTDPNGVTWGYYGADPGDVPGATTNSRQVADVDGDGVVDLLVASPRSTTKVQREGEIHVYSGGAALVGTVAPTARLRGSTASPNDGLGSNFGGRGYQAIDLDADGLLDVVASNGLATVGGLPFVGVLYSWKGGPGLAGVLNETARYAVTGGAREDYLSAYISCHPTWFADCDDDGVLDLLVLAPQTDFGGTSDVGVVRWWRGPVQPGDPTATLSVPGAKKDDELGR